MAFVDVTDFNELPYKIPNQNEAREFVTFIEKEETKILKKLLGIDLYNEFIEGLATSGEVEERWTELRDGVEYEYNGVTYEYLGLVDLLVPAIYSIWVQTTYRRFTSSGVIVNKGQQNTEAVNPSYEIVQNWNEYVKKVGGVCGQEGTLYGFMTANEDDYEDWEFTEPELKNTLDL